MKQHTRTTDDGLRIVRELQSGQRRPLDTSPAHTQAKRKEFKRTPQPDTCKRTGGYFSWREETPGMSAPYTNQRKRRKRARQNG